MFVLTKLARMIHNRNRCTQTQVLLATTTTLDLLAALQNDDANNHYLG